MKAKSVLTTFWIGVSASLLFLALFELMGGWEGDFWPLEIIYSMHLTLALLGAAVAVFVHNRPVDLIRTELDAEVVAGSVEQHLQRIGYAVGSTDQRINVLLDRSRNARIEVKETESGSELDVFPSLTRDGLGSIFSYIVILPFCGTVAMWMSFTSLRKTEEFSRNVLRPTLLYVEGREKAKGSELPQIGTVITASLRKANHLATEAFRGLYASYSDWKWLIPLAGFFSYFALVFGLILTRDWNAAWPDYYTYFLEFMLAAIVVIVILLMIWLRLRYRQESEEVNLRIGRLQAAIYREEGAVKTVDGDESAMETLLNVCPDLPRWTKYRTRNFSMRNPGISTIIGWAFFMLVITWGGLASISLGQPIALVILIALVSLYVVTKWRNVRSDKRSLEEWRSRIGTLKDEIEKKLQEL